MQPAAQFGLFEGRIAPGGLGSSVCSQHIVTRRARLATSRGPLLPWTAPPWRHAGRGNSVLVCKSCNIIIQVLPRDVGGSPGLEGPFSLYTLPQPIPDIGYIEGAAGTFYIEDQNRVRYWVLRFGILTQRARAQWRISSFFDDTGGSNGGSCVEVGALPDGRIAVRNSHHPDAGAVFFTRAEMDAGIKGVKAGEFDDLA
jgi:hypothetical protein